MKLAARMTLAIGAWALLFFGAAGVFQLRSEEKELRTVAANEALLLGRSLQVAFENALRDKQIEDVAETLEALSAMDPTVTIFVFDGQGRLVGSSRSAEPSAEVREAERRARKHPEPLLEINDRSDQGGLRLGLRLREETPTSNSAIVLEKPLTELRRDIRATRFNIVATTLGFVATSAALTWLLTRRYVGVPLARLVAKMRRVRPGKPDVAAASARADEVGETEEEFDRLVADLETEQRRADQQSEARRRMERALQDADKLITLGQLSAVMAHEIGSPLQVLEGRARALVKHADDPAATRRTAEMLVEQTQRITRIVAQMLSITRRRAPVRSLVNLEDSLRSVLALLEVEARRKRVELVLERAGRSDVIADGDQLQQVALNLIRNALQAAPERSTVRVLVGGDDERLVLEVHDEGPGVAEADRAHLFEPFFTTKASSGGTGLGLSVVKSIVQAHHGEVAFVDSSQPGCLVRVVLPRTPPERNER